MELAVRICVSRADRAANLSVMIPSEPWGSFARSTNLHLGVAEQIVQTRKQYVYSCHRIDYLVCNVTYLAIHDALPQQLEML
jgi:hypothetical protein